MADKTSTKGDAVRDAAADDQIIVVPDLDEVGPAADLAPEPLGVHDAPLPSFVPASKPDELADAGLGLRDQARRQWLRAREESARWLRERKRARARKRGGASNRSAMMLLGGLALLFGLTAWAVWFIQPEDVGEQMAFGQFQQRVAKGEVLDVTLLDEDARIVGTYVELPSSLERQPEPDSPFAAEEAEEGPRNIFRRAVDVIGVDLTRFDAITFTTDYPASDAATGPLLADLAEAGVLADVDHQGAKGTVRLLATVLLPLMILANLFALLFVGSRDSGGAIGELTDFASVGEGRGIRRKGPQVVTFDSVAGADEAVVEMKEVVDYLVNPDKYAALGAAPPKGVLLFGPPGCGKTLIAKAVAGEAGVPFFSVAGAEFVEQLVGVGAARVRDLFARVRAAAPAIVFIDELDAAGRKRGSGDSGGGTDEREQTLNQLLVEMDGFDVSSGIVVIGATNRPDILDPALLRPGRFDRHVTVEKPDPDGREEILRLHAGNKPVADEIDWADIARRTPGYTGADLANVVNEAALLTIRQGKPAIERSEVVEAIARVRGGTTGKRTMTLEEKGRVAVHEAAHAVVVAATGGTDNIDRVTILSRGGALGGTRLHEGEETSIDTESQLLDRLTRHMAGHAGELLILEEPSSASEGDLEAATTVALDIVARYGMAEDLGPVRLLAHDSDGYLGGTSRIGDISPETHRTIDQAVRSLVEWGRDRAWNLIEANRTVVDELTEALLDREHVEGQALRDILAKVATEEK